MSYTVSVNGTSSVLTHTFQPQISLEGEHELALMLLETYNTIPNVHAGNNKFHYGDGKVVEIEAGSYEIIDLIEFIEQKLNPKSVLDDILSPTDESKEKVIDISEKRATFQIEILCKLDIDFSRPDSIGRIFGFEKRVLKAGKTHTSDSRVRPFEIDTILVSTNITSNWYINDKPTHAIYQSVIEAAPGNRLNIQPKHLIYFPIVTRNLHEVVFKITDQDHNLINFNGGFITLCAHIRKSNAA